MSPIPSVASTSALSPGTPSVALDPDSAGQSASVMSQHLLGTGGLLFAVVALLSVAGYFYRGRGVTDNTRTSNTWISLTGLLSSMHHRSSATTSTAAATDWPVDLEVGFDQHVSMVYAKFFHPTFWSLVECHPATSSAPAICVEEEANENPVSDPKPPGRNSFLSMDDDDDDDDDWDGDDGAKPARKKPDRDRRAKVRELPPYDTGSPINVNFSSEIIGTTVRPGAFLSIPGQAEDDAPDTSPSDSDMDFSSSPYDGISTADSEEEFPCSPYDGIVTTESESDVSCLPYDGVVTMSPRSSSSTRRYGMADMAYIAKSLKDTVLEEGYGLVPTISPRTGLLDLSRFTETDPTLSSGSLERLGPVDTESTISNCDISVHDSHDGLADSSSDADTVASPHDGLDLMRKLLAELRDPNMDCTPRALSEDSDSEYYGDDEEEPSVPCLTSAQLPYTARRNSLESTSSPGTDSDVSDEGLIYPFTPPSKPTTSLAGVPDVHKDRISSPVMARFNKEVLVMSPTFLDSPILFPAKAYVRSHRDSRSLLYGVRVPLVNLPRF